MEESTKKRGIEFCKKGLQVILFVASYTLLPVTFCIVALPLAAIHTFAIWSARVFQPELKHAVTPESGIVCADDFWGEPYHVVGGPLYTDRPVTIDCVIKRLKEILEGGKFKELQCNLQRWMGILFWKQASTFSLENHVNELPHVRTLEEFQAQHALLFRKPFVRNQPLWEITVLPNYKHKGGSAFLIRFHHVLTDGLGFRSFLHALAGTEDLAPQTPPLTWMQWFQATVQHPAVQFKLAASFFFHDFNWNSWIKSKDVWSLRPHVYTKQSHVPIATIKKAGSQGGATVSEVMLAGLTTALMEEGPDPLPHHMSGFFPLPKPGHPGTLTNHAYLTTLAFPLNEKDHIKRLWLIREEHRFKRKTAPMLDMAIQLAGILLQITQWRLPSLPHLCSLSVSNVSLTPKPWTMFGAQVTDADLTIDVAYHIPLIVVFLGYVDKINVIARGRSDVFEEYQLQRIVDKVVSYVEEIAQPQEKNDYTLHY